MYDSDSSNSSSDNKEEDSEESSEEKKENLLIFEKKEEKEEKTNKRRIKKTKKNKKTSWIDGTELINKIDKSIERIKEYQLKNKFEIDKRFNWTNLFTKDNWNLSFYWRR